MLVEMKCPNCGAQLNFDDEKGIAFCSYCGSKLANVAEQIHVNVKADYSDEIENLLMRANEAYANGEIDRTLEYCTQILDMDADNEEAKALEQLASAVNTHPNLTIQTSWQGTQKTLKISIDGEPWQVVPAGRPVYFILQPGLHAIEFHVGKRYIRKIYIKDRSTDIRIAFIGGGTNRIQISGMPEIPQDAAPVNELTARVIKRGFRPIYQRCWFWVLIVCVILTIIIMLTGTPN